MNSIVIPIYKNGGKRIFEFGDRLNPPHWPPKFENPHYKAKTIVVVNPIYGYQNLSGEKYKRNGKRISSIRHTSEEKSPKNHPKYHISGKCIFGWFFGFFSSLVCRIELILFPLLLYFSPDRFWYPYIKFTTTFFLAL